MTNLDLDLDYILSHFDQPLFPRIISTKTTGGRQIIVNSRKEALSRFAQANGLDCRISAYSPNVDENPSAVARFQGIRKTTPANLIIMIDLDRCNFKTIQALRIVLSRTLNNIKNTLGDDVNPTVLWSGNGYHVYLVLDSSGVDLEHERIFTNLSDQPTRRFLQFAEKFLSHGNSDRLHNKTVSLKNCMLRIPGSYNSKNNAQVTIVKPWEGRCKPKINYLLSDFCIYLAAQKAEELRERQQPWTNYRQPSSGNYTSEWIEKLLQTPIPDGRKYSIWRILVPYLINRKHLSEKQCASRIIDWLDKCGQQSRLGFNVDQRVKDAIKHVRMYGPLRPDVMKKEYPEFYNLLLKHKVLQ